MQGFSCMSDVLATGTGGTGRAHPTRIVASMAIPMIVLIIVTSSLSHHIATGAKQERPQGCSQGPVTRLPSLALRFPLLGALI